MLPASIDITKCFLWWSLFSRSMKAAHISLLCMKRDRYDMTRSWNTHRRSTLSWLILIQGHLATDMRTWHAVKILKESNYRIKKITLRFCWLLLFYSHLLSVDRCTGWCMEHVYAFSCKTHLVVVRLSQQHISAVRGVRWGEGGGGGWRVQPDLHSTFVFYAHLRGFCKNHQPTKSTHFMLEV